MAQVRASRRDAPASHRGVHIGRIILEGTAPDGLMWRLGVDDNGDHMIVWGRHIIETVADAA